MPLESLQNGRYQTVRELGSGSMGEVYLVDDTVIDRKVAIKVMRADPAAYPDSNAVKDAVRLFKREAQAIARLEHPHILPLFDFGEEKREQTVFTYMVMPHCQEGSLANWLLQFSGKQAEPAEVARIIVQVADALQFLHTRGLLYQNFKMSNLLVTNSTQKMRDVQVALADLPLVQDIISLPKTTESYRYYAPEQWENEAFTSSDQYGLAVLTYELLTGRAPFQGNSDAIMRRMHLTMPAPPPSSFNPHIYPVIDKVMLRALAKHPEERFESIGAFATALEQAAR